MSLSNSAVLNSNEIDFDEQFFSEFEYLQQDQQELVPSPSPEANDDNFGEDEVFSSLKSLDANTLNLNELLLELERRGIQAKGFFADDAQVLQGEFEKELKQYMACKRMEIIAARKLDAAQADKQSRDKVKEKQLNDENALVLQNSKMRWLHHIIRGPANSNAQSNPHVRIRVPNDAAARLLAKALWTSSAIVSLDLTRMGLSDVMGAYVCRALRHNTSLLKLELGENKLGEETCLALEFSMRSNNVLKYISLDSNPLVAKSDTSEVSCVQALASIIERNSSLTAFILWRCGIGPIGGELIARSILNNNSLICLEIGYNNWKPEDLQIITNQLDKNKAVHKLQTEATQQKLEAKRNKRLHDEHLESIKAEKERIEQWLIQQEMLRCKERIVEMKEAERKAKEIARQGEERCRQAKLTLDALRVKNPKTNGTTKTKGAKGKKTAK